ncbi:glutamate racemase [Oceanisphaera avium]|uniref:Glutamate racemase n=1 Tax=Oceanisphaera avium TaxID=1903694 RepID=A0A1Y0CYB7_9GAMM|nr:glutamate racemase [Oceanisphaera avium]ART80299.1 glutamate racemase [Oceanisphaera avium]
MANILIFDSGMGGLSVYRELSKRIPAQQYLYLFDNAYFPYGELSEPRLVARVVELFSTFVKQHSVDIAVIACNTASTYVLPALRAQLSIPIVGVVPAIKPAAEYSRQHQTLAKPAHIGLLATPGTISRRYTAELVQSFAPDIQVSMLGTTELVKMAEDKLAGLPVDIKRLKQILAPWSGNRGPDTLVLGCTHFPLLATEINQCLPQVKLIDSGAAIARRVSYLLLQPACTLSQELAPEGKAGLLFCTELTKKALQQARAFKKEGFSELNCFEPNLNKLLKEQ